MKCLRFRLWPALGLLLAPVTSMAWPSSPTVNLAISDTAGLAQENPVVIAERDGGAHFIWGQDGQNLPGRIFAIRLDATGAPAFGFPSGGARIQPGAGATSSDQFAFPGGGYLLVWGSSGSVRAQRFDTTGQAIWLAGGVQVSDPIDVASGGWRIDIGPDGATSVVYEVHPDPLFPDIQDLRAMRVDSTGQRVWIQSAAVCAGLPNTPFVSQPRDLERVRVLPDGSLVTFWVDRRDGILSGSLYGQRLDASGQPLWQANGVPLVNAFPGYFYVNEDLRFVHPDSSDGCFAAIVDRRSVPEGDVTLLRIRSDGTHYPGWEGGRGVASPAVERQLYGGAEAPGSDFYVVFSQPPASGQGLWAQRFDASGLPRWEPAGRRLWASLYPSRGRNGVLADGEGGLFAFGTVDTPNLDTRQDLRAGRFDPDGAPLWGTAGVAVTTAPLDQRDPAGAADGSGGLFMVWEDQRAGEPEWDIYAQHVNADGTLGGTVTATTAAAISATRSDGCVRVEWASTESAGLAFQAERSQDGGEWQVVARLFADGVGRVRLEDCGLPRGGTLAYRLTWFGPQGAFHSQPISLMQESPMTLSLAVASPTEDRTRFEFVLPQVARVRLEVFDLAGRRVAVVADGVREAGVHRVEWMARDASGAALASGLYVVRLAGDDTTLSQRLILTR